MRIIHEPRVFLLSRQVLDPAGIEAFLEAQGTSWETDTEVGAEMLCELAGRICYFSLGAQQGRKSNTEYLHHILECGHGSVLEHAVWSFLITGVSRSFTHELVRHRAGFAYSQLSQRYVDESLAEMIEPDIIAGDEELHATWLAAVEQSQAAYQALVEKLTEQLNYRHPDLDQTSRRKMARQAARSVLPNATETKIFVTANARALRHFLELRGSQFAEPEIRKVAVKILELLRQESPALFGDYELQPLPDGSQAISTPHRKV